MPTTPRGAPYPAPGAANDVPGDLQALAGWANDRPGITPMSTATRNTLAGGDLWGGRIVYDTTLGQHLARLGGTWRLLPAEASVDGTWQTYTPTVGNGTAAAASARWRLLGKSLLIQGTLAAVQQYDAANPLRISIPRSRATPSSTQVVGLAYLGGTDGSSPPVWGAVGDPGHVRVNLGTTGVTHPGVSFTAEYEIA